MKGIAFLCLCVLFLKNAASFSFNRFKLPGSTCFAGPLLAQQKSMDGEPLYIQDKGHPSARKRKIFIQKDLVRGPDGVPTERVKVMRFGRRVKSSSASTVMDSGEEDLGTTRQDGKRTGGGSGGKRIRKQGVSREREINNPNRLRILGGTAKGKKIDSPDVYLRPMMAKVREALFSTLNHMGMFDTNTTRVLDVFSGSGSVGLEALSRGAAHTTFIDMSPDCTDTALGNAAHCGFPGQASAVTARAEEVFRNPAQYGLSQKYDFISITPPYEEIVYSDLINDVKNSPLVGENTVIVIEYPIEMDALPHIIGDNELFGIRNRKYGRTILGMYVYRPTKQYDMRPDEFA